MKNIVFVPNKFDVIERPDILEPYICTVMEIDDFPMHVYMSNDVLGESTRSMYRSEFLHIVKLIAETEKITAIKMVRAASGWGLKEAKEFTEYLMGIELSSF